MEQEYRQHVLFVTPEERDRLEAAAAKADEYLKLAQRAQADFLNYQDRMKRERENLVKYGVESLLLEFLPVVDDLEQSLASMGEEKALKPYKEATEMIRRKLLDLLRRNNVRPIEAEARPFDPLVHEALMMEETDRAAENAVIAVLRSGYTLHDRVLRAAQVKVAKKPK